MAELLDICRFAASSTGTGPFGDGTATQGFLNFEDAGAVNGSLYPYRAENATRTEWEIGYGQAIESSDGFSLDRVDVRKSTNGGATVDFATAPVVLITPLVGELSPQRPPYDVVGHYETGDFAECQQTIEVTTGSGSSFPILQMPIDVEEGDILYVLCEAEFTNNNAYNVGIFSGLILGSSPGALTGTEISEENGFNISVNMHHGVLTHTGSVTCPTTGLYWVTLKARAAASGAGGGDFVTVEQDYGRLSVLHLRPNITPGLFDAGAVTFDGTNDYLSLGAPLRATVDKKTISGSFWIKMPADATTAYVVSSSLSAGVANASIRFGRNSSNAFFLQAEGTDTALKLNISSSTGSILAADGWVNVLFSADLSDTGKRNIYIDDVSDLATVTTYTNANIDWTLGDWSVGALCDGSSKTAFDVAELWLSDQFIDFSVEANRRKFIDASGKPVDLGYNGKNPTGGPPLIYLRGATDSWHLNRGKGGGFTENGALTSASTSPSD